jgi:molybdenum cofactor cytidylyltransferase
MSPLSTSIERSPMSTLLLAAGSSSRLGQSKQLLELGGETLVHRAARQALACCSGPVVCVLGAAAEATQMAVDDLPIQICINKDWRSGMASSLRHGIEALPASSLATMVLLCDQIRITVSDLQRLQSAWRPDQVAAARYQNVLGVPAIFPARLFSDLAALEGDQGARRLLRDTEPPPIEVGMPTAAFDLDRPEDLLHLNVNDAE